jgi:predicted type IV restriction endonuclease
MSTTATFDLFQRELARLADTVGKNLAAYKSPGYDEASLRQEFLNPFFRALGWDVENTAGLIPQHRDVEIESRTQIGGRQKRADYLFRTHPTDRFVCEAKKPAEELHATYAFQAKRYAWNKGLLLAVLTDFEELKIFIVGGKPSKAEPDVGLWKTTGFPRAHSSA